jgi:hypothetical protein
VLPTVGGSEALRKAYIAGPHTRLFNACGQLAERIRGRGEAWPAARDDALLAAVAWLQQRMAMTGRQAQQQWIDDAIDFVILPAMSGLVTA